MTVKACLKEQNVNSLHWCLVCFDPARAPCPFFQSPLWPFFPFLSVCLSHCAPDCDLQPLGIQPTTQRTPSLSVTVCSPVLSLLFGTTTWDTCLNVTCFVTCILKNTPFSVLQITSSLSSA